MAVFVSELSDCWYL